MHLVSLTGAVALRVACVAVGTWFGAIAPVEFIAQGHRAANLAAGYAPNMDPSALVTLAAMLAVPGLTLALLAEMARCWAMNGKPLAAISHVALGILVACPIGYAFAVPGARVGHLALLVSSSLALALFYLVRQGWLLAVARRGRARDSAA